MGLQVTAANLGGCSLPTTHLELTNCSLKTLKTASKFLKAITLNPPLVLVVQSAAKKPGDL
jgi:hypothetical protein